MVHHTQQGYGTQRVVSHHFRRVRKILRCGWCGRRIPQRKRKNDGISYGYCGGVQGIAGHSRSGIGLL